MKNNTRDKQPPRVDSVGTEPEAPTKNNIFYHILKSSVLITTTTKKRNTRPKHSF
jgi:hypothetical protein